jgi:hypothetical protein
MYGGKNPIEALEDYLCVCGGEVASCTADSGTIAQPPTHRNIVPSLAHVTRIVHYKLSPHFWGLGICNQLYSCTHMPAAAEGLSIGRHAE